VTAGFVVVFCDFADTAFEVAPTAGAEVTFADTVGVAVTLVFVAVTLAAGVFIWVILDLAGELLSALLPARDKIAEVLMMSRRITAPMMIVWCSGFMCTEFFVVILFGLSELTNVFQGRDQESLLQGT
jgi:hypothetical protein